MKFRVSIAAVALLFVSLVSVGNASAFGSSSRLNVSKSGSGSGTVTSYSARISCGYSCSANTPYGAYVTLYASPSPGSTFSGWTGACFSSYTTCTLSMTSSKFVTASFTITRNSLYVYRGGSGSGTVRSSHPNLSCDSWRCSGTFASNTSVTLYASPSPGSTFSGWSGSCFSRLTTCTVSMASSRSVTASFNRR